MAKLVAVDTNVLLRYFLHDDSVLGKRADRIIDAAKEGKITLWISQFVLAELVWVLESFYRLPKLEIVEKVKGIIATPGVVLAEEKRTVTAFMFYAEKSVDFDDALIAIEAREARVSFIASFDKDFSKFPWLTRWEPSR